MAKKLLFSVSFEKTLRQILSIPTVPLAEHWLREHIIGRFRRSKRVSSQTDLYGNLLLSYRPGRKRKAALCFQAHMDHPGFSYTGATEEGHGEAVVLGQIPLKSRGETLLFHTTPDGTGIPATITKVIKQGKRAVMVCLETAEEIPRGTPGTWSFSAFSVKGSEVLSRGHDDTLGSAVLVHLLHQASRKRFAYPFDVLLTRAEEIGLAGTLAITLNKSLKLPPNIITIEMPRARGEVEYGKGVVCRVGDGVCTYDQKLLSHIDTVARACAQSDPAFRCQRRLAWAGRTEASQFAFSGYRTAAVCLATRNGHNIAPGGRPAPEIVDANDLTSLMTLVEKLAETPVAVDRSWRQLQKLLEAQGRHLVRHLK